MSDFESRYRHAHAQSNFDTLHAKAIDVGRRPMRLGMFMALCVGAVVVGGFMIRALIAVVM